MRRQESLITLLLLSLLFSPQPADPLATMLHGSSMQLVSGTPSELQVRPILLWFEAGPTAVSKLGSIFYSIDAEGSSHQQRQKREGQSMPLERLNDVFLGAQQPLFRCPAALERAFDSARCFSLVSKALTLHLVAETADERNAWLRGIKERFITRKANRAESAGAGAAAAAAAAVPARLHSPPSLSVLKPLLIAGHRMHRLSLKDQGSELSIKPVFVWWQPCDASSDASLSSRGRTLGELCWVDCPLDTSASPTALEVLKHKVAGQSLPLNRIADVFLGSQRPIFRNAAASFASDRCFTLDAAASRSRYEGINLVAASHAEREVWVQGIKAMFAEVKRERNAAKEHGAAAAAAAAAAVVAIPATVNVAAASSPASSPASAPGGPAVGDDAASAAVDLQSIALDVPASAAPASTSPSPSKPAAAASSSAAAAAAVPYFSEPRSFLSVVLDPSAPGGISARTIWMRHVPASSSSSAGATASSDNGGAGSLCWSNSPRAAASASAFSSADISGSGGSSLDLSSIKHIRLGASSPTLAHALEFQSIHLLPIDASAAFSLLDGSEQAGLHLLAPSAAERKAAVEAIKEIFASAVKKQQQQRRQSGEQAAATAAAVPVAVPLPAASSAAGTEQPVVISEGPALGAGDASVGNGAPPSSSNALDSSQPGRDPAEKQPPQQREIQAPRQKRKKTLWQKLTCAGDYEEQ